MKRAHDRQARTYCLHLPYAENCELSSSMVVRNSSGKRGTTLAIGLLLARKGEQSCNTDVGNNQ